MTRKTPAAGDAVRLATLLRRLARAAGPAALLAAAAPALAANTFMLPPLDQYFASRNHLVFCEPNSCARLNTAYRFTTPLKACENRIYNEIVTFSDFPLYEAHLLGPLLIPFTDFLFRDEPGFTCHAYFDIPEYPGSPARPRQTVDAAAVLVEAVCPGSAVSVRESATVARCRVTCAEGETWHAASNSCKRVNDVPWAAAPPSCPADPGFSDPIHPLRGTKREQLDLGLGIGELSLGLTYDSAAQAPRDFVDATPAAEAPADDAVLGALWSSNLHRRLVAAQTVSLNSTTPGAMLAHRGGGVTISFEREAGGSYRVDATRSDRLVALAGGRHRYHDVAAGVMEDYDAAGRLEALAWAGGGRVDLTYSDGSTPATVAPGAGHLIRATDHRGRSLDFTYVQLASPAVVRLKSVAADGTPPTVFEHDGSGQLQSITWPDGTRRGFVYENGALPWALTGVVDERSVRLSTFGYDADGRAVSSERAGGAQRHTVSYATPPRVRVTETLDPGMDVVFRVSEWVPPEGTVVTGPDGSSSTLGAASIGGRSHLVSRSQPAGSGCAASTRAQAFDASGNLASEDDFNGHRACMAHVPGRRLEATRVDGLPSGHACAGVLATNAALPADSRKTSTQWHPQWALRTRVAEPGRITTYVYHGQPDPLAGGAPASCAPADALLPDGTPLVVLCRRTEQATDDADGSLGFAAPLQPDVPPREERWTYDAAGRPLTHDGPRTDVADVTRFEYHADTAFTGSDPTATGHARGDLKQRTNALGQVTRYTLYDRRGQLLQSVDANGVVTEHAYDLRQRLTRSTVAGQSTLYDHGPEGLLRRVTLPDGSWLQFDHDDAQRLQRISDAAGNRIEYTLDGMGRRVDERVLDPGNALRRQIQRSFDALGRVQLIVGREP